MAEGILGTHKSSNLGTYEVYEVPTGKYTKANISVCSETSTFNEVVLYVTSSSTPTAGDIIQLDTLKSSIRGYDRVAIVMKAGEKIFYKTDSEGTNVIVTGFEYDANGEIFSSTETAITDGTYEVYTCDPSQTATVNLTVSLTGTGSTDKSTVDVYISKTDVASGVKLQAENLRRDRNTGFERTGFALSAGDKILVVITNLVGTISMRAAGAVRSSN